MVSPKCPCPVTMFCVLWIYSKRDFANGIKDLEMGEIILDYPVEISVRTWVIKSREIFLAVVRGKYDDRRVSEMWLCWLWGWRNGAISQQMWVASRSWKKQEKDFLAFPERNAATCSLAQWECMGLLTWTWGKDICVVLCYQVCSSKRKPIQFKTAQIGTWNVLISELQSSNS